MKFSDVSVGNCYVVIYDDVRKAEFDGRHISIVLKKNNDNRTCIVVPLTSQPNGERSNKFNLGKITSLPTNLSSVDSFVVYNQVRTVNVNRLINLKNGHGNVIQSQVNSDMLTKVKYLCLMELLKPDNFNDKIEILSDIQNILNSQKLISLAYSYKKHPSDDLKKEIQSLYVNEKYCDLALELFNIDPSIKDDIIKLISID